MPITSAHERPQPPTSPVFSDAVTFSFGDGAAEVFGLARIGLSAAAAGGPQGSGLAIVFAGTEPVAVRAAGGLPVDDGGGFEAVDAAGVRTATLEPLAAWTVSFTSEDGAVGLDLAFRALSEPAEVPADGAVAVTGGMQGYEQLCHVTGTARVRGGTRTIDCLGQRGHGWGAPDWDRLTVARSVSAWAASDLAVSLTAVRPTKAKSHADEMLAVALFVPGGAADDLAADEASLARVVVPEDSRLSTTYDGEGRQRRAGLELYEDVDGLPHRAAGSVICGTSVDLGRLRLDCSFFRWHLDGREGVGRYDIVRRTEDLA